MQTDHAEQLYQNGIAEFERGNYRNAIQQLEQARTLAMPNTSKGGQIQMWLVNAYEAIGDAERAQALCQTLVNHPDMEVRKSARYVLGIISAPKLRQPQGSTSAIPNLKQIDATADYTGAASRKSQVSSKPPTDELPPPSLPLETDYRFMIIALAIAVLGLFTIWITQ